MVLIIVLRYFKNHKMEFDCFLEFDMISAVGVKRLVTRIFLVSMAIGWVVPFTTEVKFMGIISKKRGLNWGVALKIF